MSKANRRRAIDASWYDFPEYYDVALMEDTTEEADFALAAWKKHGKGRLRRILEPGCGSGRLVRELADRGFSLVAFDDCEKSLEFVRNRMSKDSIPAELFAADLANFRVRKPVDLACSFCNTFRHLLTEDSAVEHLRRVARSLRSDGLYLLGLHLMAIDADPVDAERWICRRDGVKVATTLAVQKTFPRKRLERLRITMDVDAPTERLRIQSSTTLRLWNRVEFLALLKRVRSLELVGTYDFLCDVDDPIVLDDYSSDVVFVLQRR